MRYLVKFENYTPSATECPTVVSGSGRRIRVLEVVVGGAGATAAAQALVMSRSATGTTPSNTQTPTPHPHSEGPASNFTANRTWATAPAPAGQGIVLPYHSLGGGFRYVANQNIPALEARNGEVIVFKPATGITPQATNLSIMVEED